MPQAPARVQPIVGPTQADILIVGSFPDAFALKAGRPFAHAQETIIDNCLHQAGLIRPQVVMTNFIWDRNNIESLWRTKGAKGPSQVKGDLDPFKQSLWNVIKRVKPKVIVALGDVTSYSLIKRSKVTSVRGYPFPLGETGIWVIPSLEPGKMIFSNNEWRWYLAHDIRKARLIAEGTPVISWDKCSMTIPKSFPHVIELLGFLSQQKLMGWDIEVSDFHTSCMSFCYKKMTGIGIPIDMRWSEHEELYIWNKIASILENPNITKIVQNGVFDVQFMAQEMGIFVKGAVVDTMVSHHIMFPDFRKGLEFLGSIHTFYPYWKDELEVKTIKEES